MASAFGHIIVGGVLARAFSQNFSWKLVIVATLCAILPDIDVVGFKLGISYALPLGHRGFTHSILFAILVAILVTILLFRKSKNPWLVAICLFLSILSHDVLDAFTNGGLGIGFFIPFNNARYFFDYRPIQVSPIGIEAFFTNSGWQVIKSELIWIGIPSMIIFVFVKLFKRK